MTRRDRQEVARAVVEFQDAREDLRTVALRALDEVPSPSPAAREQLVVETQAVEAALERLADVQARLEQHVPVHGLAVSTAARYLGVSEPTVRAWLARGALTRVPAAKPLLVELASLRRVGRALAELRERGQDRDWTRALVDLLHDRADRRRPELAEGLDELRREELEPAQVVAHLVLRVPSVGRVVSGMSNRERRSYDAAVQALKGEGCRAGGKRLAALMEADYPMCQRALYGSQRMTTVYREDGSIVVVAVAKHTAADSPSATLAEIFPGLSPTGRRRSEQPACCDDPQAPPVLSAELEAVLVELFG